MWRKPRPTNGPQLSYHPSARNVEEHERRAAERSDRGNVANQPRSRARTPVESLDYPGGQRNARPPSKCKCK